MIDNDEATLKSFRHVDGYVLLMSVNKEYEPILVRDKDVKILGKLVAALKIF